MEVVAFAGSRGLSYNYLPLVCSVVGSVIRSGRSVAVGCCVGLDEMVLTNLETGLCLSAFGSNGAGSCSLSASTAVFEFAGRGGSVNYWAGGHGDLKARLSSRTQAVINCADVSVVVFLASLFLWVRLLLVALLLRVACLFSRFRVVFLALPCLLWGLALGFPLTAMVFGRVLGVGSLPRHLFFNCSQR